MWQHVMTLTFHNMTTITVSKNSDQKKKKWVIKISYISKSSWFPRHNLRRKKKVKKLWHLYFAKKWRKLDHPYKIIYTMYKQADFWLSMFGTSYVRKRFQYINFDLGHHCKSSEHNRWIKTNGNRYSFWNAYTRYIYAPKTSHQSGKNVALLWRMCIKLSTKNSQHASLWSTEFGAIGFTHPPHVKSWTDSF